MFEFPATGGVFPSSDFKTVKLIRYVTHFDYFVLACEFLFCCFLLYYVIEEGIEVKRRGLAYFANLWNILDIVVIAISFSAIASIAHTTIVVENNLEMLLSEPDKFADFTALGFWYVISYIVYGHSQRTIELPWTRSSYFPLKSYAYPDIRR